MTNFRSDLCLWGNFSMTVYDHSSGRPVKVRSVTKKNQITREGQRLLLHLLADQGTNVYYPDEGVASSISARRLGFLIVGNNGDAAAKTDTRASFNDGDDPIWTSAAFVRGSNIFVEPAGDESVEQHIRIEVASTASEISGTICEAGLVTQSEAVSEGLLYARQIFTPITMGTNMSITFNWQLGMTLP